jgi:hypothetical protein
MKTRTGQVLTVMNILAWITFFGLCIKAGAMLTSYVVSMVNEAAAKNLYMGLDLHYLRQYDQWYYTGIAILMIAIVILQAWIAFFVIKVLSKIKLSSPFTMEISRLLEKISYMILLTWVAAQLLNGNLKWLSENVSGLEQHYTSGDFIFLAGVIFIFSQVFRRGVEIQSENELTV